MDSEKQNKVQAYNIGGTIDFKVRSLFSNYCELIDEQTGVTAYLQGTAKLLLHKRQTVTCRVLAIGENGEATVYDDTWDVVIHCESEEERNKIIELLNKCLNKEKVGDNDGEE